ncbi:MAG: hypothetical protein ACYTDU_18715 [Planctomycetota bacterium]
MRRSGLSTIVGLGIVTALFMAIMSMFYLQQIPTKDDLQGLEDSLRVEHGLYLSSAARIETSLLRPHKDGERTGVRVALTLRADIRKRPKSVEVYLTRIAESILVNPEWKGRITFVTVVHAARPKVSVTRHAASAADKAP